MNARRANKMNEQEYIATYNSNIYEEEKRLIKEAENSNRLVIFVGAGTSIPSGFPSWSQAVGEMRARMDDSKNDSDKNEVKNSDDFLKIPQYYYNEHGKNNYVALMRKIFKHQQNLSPLKLHEKILNFRVKYIITTNYDNLLKKSAYDNQQVIDVVAQDSDLAYGIAEKKIIKMHGDFAHDNFVLKEDDYLSYSEHFRLIEIYIKALIAGNVVLFLGYSFSDPDLKQIFTWVKEIIGSDQPQSYIIEVAENFSAAKSNYFQNFGIKILYASKKIKHFNSKEMEKNLERMIDFLQYDSPCEKGINGVYQDLKPFMNLNYVYREYIQEVFARQQIMIDFDKDIMTALTSDSYELLQNIFSPKDNEEKLCKIREVLGKSCFYKMDFELSDINGKSTKLSALKNTINPEVEKICEAIISYDVQALKKLKEQNFEYLADSNPIFYFKQAFLLYWLNEYPDADKYIKIATTCFYDNGIYNWYFLSLLNQKILAQMIFINDSSDKRSQEIIQKSGEINLDKKFQFLSYTEDNQYLKDLYTFQISYKIFQDAHFKNFKIKEESDNPYILHFGIPAFVRLKKQIKDLWYYTTSNFLMLDHCQEYSIIFAIYGRSILESVLRQDIKTERFFDETRMPSNIRPDSLDYFDLYLILNYLTLKDIKSIVYKRGRKFIPVNSEGKIYLSKIVSNCKYLRPYQETVSLIQGHSSMTYEKLFWKIVYIVSYMEFDEFLVAGIISELENESYLEDIFRTGHQIAVLFQSVAKQSPVISNDNGVLVTTLSHYLEYMISNAEQISTDSKRSERNLQEILYTGISFYNKISGSKFSSSKLDTIMNIKYINTLAIIYPLVGEETKQKIENIAQNRQWEIDDNSFDSIYLLAQNNILTINDELEKKLLDYVVNFKYDRKKAIYDSKYNQALQYVTNLYTGGYLKDKESFSKFIKQSGNDFWEFIIDTQNFDYNKFKLDWLKDVSPKFLDELRNNEKILSVIRKKIQEKYLEGYVDEDIMRMFWEYFAM